MVFLHQKVKQILYLTLKKRETHTKNAEEGTKNYVKKPEQCK